MSLTLYFHPLSSFCWKALIAFYDAGVPFEPKVVDLGDPAERAAFQAVWPLARFAVMRDAARGRTVPESTIIIDYLAQYCPAAAGLIPADPDLARQVRLLDRLDRRSQTMGCESRSCPRNSFPTRTEFRFGHRHPQMPGHAGNASRG